MLRVRRAKPVPSRVRRAARPSAPAAQTPFTSTPVGEVSVTLTVTADVTQGKVSEQDFVAWLEDAVSRYHLWRNGWVGIGAAGKVRTPKVDCNG